MASDQTPEHYDCLAIGSGEAGKLVPWMLSAKHGQRCAVIERRWLGGACPNIACVPSKALLHSAAVAHDARTHGHAPDSLKADMKAVRDRTADVVARLNGFRGAFADFGVEVITGNAQFVGPKLVQVTGPGGVEGQGRLLTADTILICTGSRAFVDESIPGLLEARPMTHIEALELDTLPEHLIIIGGGYIGLEFAQAFRRLGAGVTVVQRRHQIIPEEDSDIVAILERALISEGVQILTDTSVTAVHGVSGQAVTVSLGNTNASAKPAPSEIRGTHVLVATGRLPNTEDLNASAAGIDSQLSGHIVVDSQLQTTATGVYAAGDCAGSPYFTHMGWDDHRVIVGAVTGQQRPGGTAGRPVPRALFTSPELARVGLNEREAQKLGLQYRVAKAGADAFLRAHTLGKAEAESTLAKLVVEDTSDKIIGFTAIGPRASELLPVISLAMKLGAGYQEIENLIITHPTMNEGLVALCLQMPPMV